MQLVSKIYLVDIKIKFNKIKAKNQQQFWEKN